MSVVVAETTCRTALVRTGIPVADYCLNPYVGCTHGCVYCYATFRRRQTRHEEPWGEFLDIKTNVGDVLAKQLDRIRSGEVIVGSVTDAYQPVERRSGLTRRCLTLLADTHLKVSLLTKSDLVTRDLDVLKAFAGLFQPKRPEEGRLKVGFSFTTLDEKLAKLLEPGAASPNRRLAALEKLSQGGIHTWVFVSPVIPGVSDDADTLARIVSRAKDCGATEVMFDPLNFYSDAVERLASTLPKWTRSAIARFEWAVNHQRKWKSSLATEIRRASLSTRTS
jgi:DNA repair photolyase